MRTRLAIAIAVGVLATGLGVGLAVGLSSSGGPSSPSTGVSQATALASVRTGCQQWLGGAPGQPGTAQWCDEMTKWMATYMARRGLGPQMMWGEPGRLATACEGWMSSSRPPGAPTDPASWCESMASWMNANVSSWGGREDWSEWMRYGPMMGAGTEPTSPATARPGTSGGAGYGPGFGPMAPGPMGGAR